MQSQPHMEYAPEEPEPPRQKRKSMAGEAADAYRKAAKPGITRQTAERHLKTHDSLLQFQVASGKGEMELSGQRKTVTVHSPESPRTAGSAGDPGSRREEEKMTEQVTISDLNWARMESLARPLRDTVDDVLDWALTIVEEAIDEGRVKPRRDATARRADPQPEQHGNGSKPAGPPAPPTGREEQPRRRRRDRQGKNGRTSQRVFRIPLLAYMHEMGSLVETQKLMDDMRTRLNYVLTEADYVTFENRQAPWRSALQGCRHQLTVEKLLHRPEPGKSWTITETGIKYLEEHLERDEDDPEPGPAAESQRSKAGAPERAGPDPGLAKTTSMNDLRMPLLEYLLELNRQADTEEMAVGVEKIVNHILTQADYRKNRSGGVRWRNALWNVKFDLTKKGLIEEGETAGSWTISEKGIRFINQTRLGIKMDLSLEESEIEAASQRQQ